MVWESPWDLRMHNNFKRALVGIINDFSVHGYFQEQNGNFTAF